jgi:hypothetical protein
VQNDTSNQVLDFLSKNMALKAMTTWIREKQGKSKNQGGYPRLKIKLS